MRRHRGSLEQLHERVVKAVSPSGKVDNQDALDRLLSLLQYVRGDYNHLDTFKELKQVLGDAKHPAHYLAIPPFLFENVIGGLHAMDLTLGARVIVEKPFGRDLASARS